MDSDYLPPLFQLGGGLAFLALLVVGVAARRAFVAVPGKLFGFGLIMVTLAMLVFSQATAGTMGRGATLFAVGAAALVLSAILIAAGLIVSARGAAARESTS